MVRFRDVLYREVVLPDWITPFLRIPEFVRLRGVRLSNVDSYEFKDFSSATRWEHGIAVAGLALRAARRRGLSTRDEATLTLAGLLHDVATPPFAHSAEYVFPDFDHEVESFRLLKASGDVHGGVGAAVYLGETGRFIPECYRLSKVLGVRVDPEEVAKLIVGQGDLGFLINGTLDLDNADNVARACLLLGHSLSKDLPLHLADWLAGQDGAPLDLEASNDSGVQEWLSLRQTLYQSFLEASDEEQGREAFIQHLMRRAFLAGVSLSTLLKQTDETFLALLGQIETHNGFLHSVHDLVTRYRLLDAPARILDISIDRPDVWQALQQPQVALWLEENLNSAGAEFFVRVNRARHSQAPRQSEIFGACGSFSVFKIGHGIRKGQLPDWVRAQVRDRETPAAALGRTLREKLESWTEQRPWIGRYTRGLSNLVTELDSVGDWGFRQTRNDVIHPYPSTFVHAIPSTLIHALGLHGELIVDPFGGTGQTLVETIRRGGIGVSADSNTMATMITRAKVAYLTGASRERLGSICRSDLLGEVSNRAPAGEEVKKWFHPRTFDELRRIFAYIERIDDQAEKLFLEVCFSAILPECTARRGKQHGYFADNAILPKGVKAPPYQKAVDTFLERLHRNLRITERMYASFYRTGEQPKVILNRAHVKQLDARVAKANDYGIAAGSAAAIITSPPYLCMADYSLGLRLSYSWLDPQRLEADFKLEIGSRRSRFRPEVTAQTYFADLAQFFEAGYSLLHSKGYLAMVVGRPSAKAFAHLDVKARLCALACARGFRLLWERSRPVQWHRNHGYHRLTEEILTIFQVDRS